VEVDVEVDNGGGGRGCGPLIIVNILTHGET
jgi:hypothetical protein